MKFCPIPRESTLAHSNSPFFLFAGVSFFAGILKLVLWYYSSYQVLSSINLCPDLAVLLSPFLESTPLPNLFLIFVTEYPLTILCSLVWMFWKYDMLRQRAVERSVVGVV